MLFTRRIPHRIYLLTEALFLALVDVPMPIIYALSTEVMNMNSLRAFGICFAFFLLFHSILVSASPLPSLIDDLWRPFEKPSYKGDSFLALRAEDMNQCVKFPILVGVKKDHKKLFGYRYDPSCKEAVKTFNAGKICQALGFGSVRVFQVSEVSDYETNYWAVVGTELKLVKPQILTDEVFWEEESKKLSWKHRTLPLKLDLLVCTL